MIPQRPAPTTIPATQAQRKFGELIRRVFSRKEHVIVEKDGLPVMAIIPMAEYETLMRQRSVREENLRRFQEIARDFGKAAREQSLTEEQAMEDLKQIRRELFQEHYGDIATEDPAEGDD